MHNLPQILNDASAQAVEWLSRLNFTTWAFAIVLLLLFPHLVREIIGLGIAIGIAVYIAAFVMVAVH
jgi:hypothetical protein